MSININDDANVTFTNTNVGAGSVMTVNETADVRPQLDELLAAIRAHESELPPDVKVEAEAAQAELATEKPKRDRIAAAMRHVTEGAASVAAVAGAAATVLRTLGMVP